MARQGFLNGKLYTYTADEEAAQDAEESKTLAEDAAIKYVNERQVGTATTVGYGTVEEQLDKLEERVSNIESVLEIEPEEEEDLEDEDESEDDK